MDEMTPISTAGSCAYVGTVMVYEFDYLDRGSNSWIRSPVPATMEAISSNGWRALVGSGRALSREFVAANGVAYRKPG